MRYRHGARSDALRIVFSNSGGFTVSVVDNGSNSRREEDIYRSVNDAFQETAMMAGAEKGNGPDSHIRDSVSPRIGTHDFGVGGHEVFENLRELSIKERGPADSIKSRAIAAAAICRKLGDTLHMTMVGGSIFPRYVANSNPSRRNRDGVFIREAIARSRGSRAPPPLFCTPTWNRTMTLQKTVGA